MGGKYFIKKDNIKKLYEYDNRTTKNILQKKCCSVANSEGRMNEEQMGCISNTYHYTEQHLHFTTRVNFLTDAIKFAKYKGKHKIYIFFF